MSVQSQIQRIKTNIQNAYTKLQEKGATIPSSKNSLNLAETITTIPESSSSDNLCEMYVTQTVDENNKCIISLSSTGASENKKVVGLLNKKIYISEV